MKMIYKFMLFCLAGSLFSGCNEYEIIKYNTKPAINFTGKDMFGEEVDEPTTFNVKRNFGLSLKGHALEVDTLVIGVKLQGMIPEHNLYLALKPLAIEGFEIPQFPFSTAPDERYYIAAGSYTAQLRVPIKRPTKRDIEYRCKLTFDFEKEADLIRGTVERQYYNVTILDQATLEMVGLKIENWNAWGATTIGAYSENKLRFMIYVLQTTNFGVMVGWGPNPDMQKQLREALIVYNQSNPGNELRDENGNLISFNPTK